MAKKPFKTVLRLDGEISEMSAKILREQIEKASPSNRIELRIASPGGSIFDGKTLLVALQAHPAGVDTVVESLAASMASVAFMMGERRTMAKGSRLMIHRPWITTAGGQATDLRRDADLLDSLEADILAAFSKTGIAEEQLKQMMADETWLTADDAVAMGFATEVFGELRGAIPHHFLNKFENVPDDVMQMASPEAETSAEDIVAEASDVAVPLPQSKSQLQARVKNLTVELHARTVERDNARQALARTKHLLHALECYAGVAPASVLVQCPTFEEEVASPLEQMQKLSDEAQTRFYKEHREKIQSELERKRSR
jgi:ATP-dependent protease ClpP protease subunit